MAGPKGGSDFLINIDSNVNAVIAQINQAIKAAEKLEKTIPRAQNKAMQSEMSFGGGRSGGGSTRVTSPELVAALNGLNSNILALTSALRAGAFGGRGGGAPFTASAMAGVGVPKDGSKLLGPGAFIAPTSGFSANQIAAITKQREKLSADELALAQKHKNTLELLEVKHQNKLETMRLGSAVKGAQADEKIAKKRAADAVKNRFSLQKEEDAANKSFVRNAMIRMQISDQIANKTLRHKVGDKFTLAKEGATQERQGQKDIQNFVRFSQRGQGFQRNFDKSQESVEGKSVIEDAFRRALVWGAVSAAIYKTIDAAGQFLGIMIQMDKQIADLRKTVSGTDADFKKLVDSSINIARSYKVGTQDVLDAVEIFSKQFKNANDLEQLAKSAALFSNISGQTIQQSAESLTSTIQQYNMSAIEASRITDSWAAVAANSAVTINDLGDAVGVVGQVADTAGVKFDQLNAMVSVVAASTGKSGKEIGNAFKRIFERTFAPENREMIEGAFKNQKTGKTEAGIALGSSTNPGEFRDFSSILEETSLRWDTMSKTQQKNIAIAFAGARQYDSFIALMTNWNDVTKQTIVSQNSFGAAQKQNDSIADTFVKKIQALKNEFDSMARTLGDTVLPVLGFLVDGFTKLLKIISSIPGLTHVATVALAALTAQMVGNFAISQFGGGALKTVGGSAATSRISKMAAPFMVGAGTDAAQFSLLQGLRSAGGAQTAAAGVQRTGAIDKGMKFLNPALIGGGIGSSVGTGTNAAVLGAGIATVVAVLGSFAAAIVSVSHLMEELGRDTKDVVKSTYEKLSSNQAEVFGMKEAADRMKDLAATAGSEAEGGGISLDTKRAVGNILASQSGDKDFSRFLTSIGVGVGAGGMAQGLSVGNLSKIQGKLASRAKEKELGGLKGFFTADAEDMRNGLFDRTFGAQEVAGFKAVGEMASRDFEDVWGKISRVGGRKADKQKFTPKLFEVGRIEKEDQRSNAMAELLKSMGVDSTSANVQAKDIGNEMKALSDAATDSQRDFLSRITLVLMDRFKDPELVKKIISTAEKTFFGGGEDRGVTNKALAREFMAGVPETPGLKGGSFLGDTKKGKLRGFIPKPVTRIDLELQKSLSDSSTNYKNLGSEINIAEEAVNAYKRAIMDLGVETQKAAGPEEEKAFIQRQEIIFRKRKQITDLQKKDTEQNRNKIDALENEVFALENVQQAIQKENEERKKGLEILQSYLRPLSIIASAGRILQSSLSGTLSSIPSLTREGILTGRQLGADEDFAKQQLGRIEGKRIDPSQFKTATEYQNALIRQRNAAKEVREQIDAINKAMQENIEKTSIWGNLMQKIGDSIISTIADKLSQMAIGGLIDGASGALSLGSLFGSSNPTSDVLGGGTDLSGIAGGIAGVGAIGGAAFGLGGGAAGSIPGQGGMSLMSAEEIKKSATPSGAQRLGFFAGKGWQAGLGGATIGAGFGGMVTSGAGKKGPLGMLGGGIGGLAGGLLGGPGGAMVGGLLGGLLGFFDKDIDPNKQTLPEEEIEVQQELVYEIQQLSKNLNTVNETMENIINAPANFVLPIPKGILENSITSQSAIATPLQAGGLIVRSGPAFLHAGERVTSASQSSGGMNGFNMSNNIVINGANSDPQSIADAVMDKINSSFFVQSQRSGRSGRF